ncbi:MAG TPA: peptidylprolyl isomerase [Gemmatimonadaceae bacterium]|nr:peptidylprolyl isomerase [Gemmatimonadaceae bacterium]
MLIRLTYLLALFVVACGGERGPEVGDRKAADSAGTVVGLPSGPTDPTAPNEFRVLFETSKGPFVVEVHRDWAPRGADRFYHLVQSRYFDDVRFFRVVSSFMAQFGMHGNPNVHEAWDKMVIPDDSVKESNRRGYVTFATAGPNSRTTQIFINIVNNRPLDEMGFAPFGRVVEGMATVDSLYADYGDAPPGGVGPDQTRITREGNAYLQREFPNLDYIRSARLVTDSAGAAKRDTSAR